MGLGMQIAYLGFSGSNVIEREAGIELLRLAGIATDIVDCRLTIKSRPDPAGQPLYDAQLVLLTHDWEQLTVQRNTDADPTIAMRHAFDDALRLLRKRY
ncbi:hypothetical protein NOV72_02765 [Caballeronia novacaledonica]|uniref:Uncharacterized protein n=1 Tax=Caballeronia novacaledonica TaxID=1544861 RepID=A0A2U3I611_9BURK|nr:hypothetical protein [Caballeronia novacaledonica]SPB15545.1 hypothetical protein NOV72_02765 [Caballeronia novacaledonica]